MKLFISIFDGHSMKNLVIDADSYEETEGKFWVQKSDRGNICVPASSVFYLEEFDEDDSHLPVFQQF